jgi:hypothetical protein
MTGTGAASAAGSFGKRLGRKGRVCYLAGEIDILVT